MKSSRAWVVYSFIRVGIFAIALAGLLLLLQGRPIRLFNEGRMRRDFTFIADIVAGIVAALDHPPAEPAHRLYNIGNSHPEELLDMVAILEELLGVKLTPA